MASLNSEFKIKNHTIKNRVVLPAIVRFGWSDDNGFVSKKHIEHYEKIARGGAGLIVVEATAVKKDGRIANSQLGIWSDDHIEGLSKIADVCRKYGAVVLVQIHSAGIRTSKTVTNDIVAPSAVTLNGVTSRALTGDEIHKLQRDFIEAAKRAMKACFDGIEFHGAHSYLIDQFMSPITNKREDEYGGSIENRMRFALEIIDGVNSEKTRDFIIGYRLGGIAPTIEEGIQIAKVLEKKGVDLLHVSWGIAGNNLPAVPEGFPFNWVVYTGTEIKKNVQIPVIVVNGIRKPEEASYLIENNLSDFVALARAQLADPEWTNKALNGAAIKACLECRPKCKWYINGDKCPRNIAAI